jgi:hypothetical protein
MRKYFNINKNYMAKNNEKESKILEVDFDKMSKKIVSI